MSIYTGQSTNNYGDIKLGNKSFNYVIHNNIVIWPPLTNYLFWYQQAEEPSVSSSRAYSFAAKEEDFTLYIRSTDSTYRKAYNFKIVDCPDWLIINNGSELVTIDPSFVPDQEKCDVKLSCHINSNPSKESRTESVKFVQLNDDYTETGATFSISFTQSFDYASGKPDYTSNRDDWVNAEFYTDESFTIRTYEYTGASQTNGSTTVYFLIRGTVSTIAGETSETLFGENGETLTVDDIIVSTIAPEDGQSEYIKDVSSVVYLGSGHWKATINWKDNTSSSGGVEYSIDNVEFSPKKAPAEGGEQVVTFDIYQSSDAGDRQVYLWIHVPESSDYDGYGYGGDIILKQDGGNHSEKTAFGDEYMIAGEYGAMNQIYNPNWQSDGTVDDAWFKIKYDSTFKKYKTTVTWYPQTTTNTYSIKLKEDSFSVDSTGTNTHTLNFNIYKVEGSADERKNELAVCFIEGEHGVWEKVGSPIGLVDGITQEGIEGGTTTQIINQNDGAVSISDNSSWIHTNIFPFFGSNGTWEWTYKVDANPKSDSGYKISELSYPSSVAATAGTYSVRFKVTSGESNSNERVYNYAIKYTPNASNEASVSANYRISQSGSTDAQNTAYHDDIPSSSFTTNISNLKYASVNTSSHIYTFTLTTTDNNNYDSSNIVSTSITNTNMSLSSDAPTQVVDDNDEVSEYLVNFTMTAVGYNYYKGVSKDISFTILLSSHSTSVSGSITQLGKDSVQASSTTTITSVDSSKISFKTDDTNIEAGLRSIKWNSSNSRFDGVLYFTPYDETDNYEFDASVNGSYADTVYLPNTAGTYKLYACWTYDISSTKVTISGYYDNALKDLHTYPIPYTGDESYFDEYNIDWYYLDPAPDAFFNYYNDASISVDKNTSTSRLSAELTFETLSCPEDFQKTITIIQEAAESYEYTYKQTDAVYIDYKDGKVISGSVTIKCSRSDGTIPDIQINSITSGFSVVTTSKNSDGYTIIVTSSRNKTSATACVVSIGILDQDQLLLVGSLDANTYQYGYNFALNPTSYTFTKSSTYSQFATIKSTKELPGGESSTLDYSYVSSASWLSFSGGRFVASGTSTTQRTGYVTFTQEYTGLTVSFAGTQTGYSDADFSTTSLDLYVENSTIDVNSVTFTSKINNTAAPPSAKWDSSTISGTLSITNNGSGSYTVKVTNYGVLSGKTAKTSSITISNSSGTLGTISVTQHALFFSASSSTNQSSGSITLGSATNSQSSLTIYNYIDGSTDTTHLGTASGFSSVYFTIIAISSSSVTARTDTDNTTGSPITATCTVNQRCGGVNTGLSFDILLSQSSVSGSISTSAIDFNYDTSVYRSVSGSGTITAQVTSGSSWLSTSVSGSTVTFTAKGGNSSYLNANNAAVLYGSSISPYTGAVTVYCDGTSIGTISCTQHSFALNTKALTLSPDAQSISVVTSSYKDKTSGHGYSLSTTSTAWILDSCTRVNANTSGNYRTGYVTIKQNDSLLTQMVKIVQNGYSINSSISSGSAIHFYTEGDGTKTSTMTLNTITESGTTSSSPTFTISNSASWLSVSQSGSTISFTPNWSSMSSTKNNTGGYKVYTGSSSLSTTVTISYQGIALASFTVYVHSFQFSISPTSISGPAGTISVTSTMDGSTSTKYEITTGMSLETSSTTGTGINSSSVTFYNTKITGSSPNSKVYLTQYTSSLQLTLTQDYTSSSWTAHNS